MNISASSLSRRNWYAAIALAMVFPLAACDIALNASREQETDEWKKSYTLAPNAQVEIINVNGRINAEAAEGPTLDVRAERIGKGSTPQAAKEALQRIEIKEDVTGGNVRIETKVPRMNFGGGGTEVRYYVRIPAGVRVRLQTVNGGVDATGLKGATRLETTNGGVRARGLSGPVEAATTNGGLEIALESVANEGVTLEVTNGGIELSLPHDARADISASITNGGIDTSGLQIDAAERSRRRLEGRLNGGGPKIRLEGTNGGIRISGR